MPQYKSIAFDPPVNRDSPAAVTAKQLQELIQAETKDGWEFVGVQNHSTIVPGNAGCFGIGEVAPYPKTVSIAVFRK